MYSIETPGGKRIADGLTIGEACKMQPKELGCRIFDPVTDKVYYYWTKEGWKEPI